jgi:hypothetical protein
LIRSSLSSFDEKVHLDSSFLLGICDVFQFNLNKLKTQSEMTKNLIKLSNIPGRKSLHSRFSLKTMKIIH